MSKNPTRTASRALPLLAALSMAACGNGGHTTDTSRPAAATRYTIGGSVVGLAGTVVLQNNGIDDLTVTGSTAFAFSLAMPSGAFYRSTVLKQPPDLSCTVVGGSGTVQASDVTNIVISCSARPAAVLARFAGDPSGAIGTSANFNQPTGIATDLAANVYVADQGNNTILKITTDGTVTNFAGTAGVTGSADGTGPAATFNVPTSIATDLAGNLFVTDTANELIRKITSAGNVTTLAGTVGTRGFSDGNGTAASFTLPYGATTDRAGNLFVADSAFCTLRRITPAGDVTTPTGMALGARHDCTGSGGQLNGPFGLGVDLDGNLYVAHTPDQVIIKITPAYAVSALAGTPGFSGDVDGVSTVASFNSPLGVATDSVGNVYVADTLNQTVRKITPAGMVTTLVGVSGTAGFTPGALPGLLSHPRGLAISGTTLYITVDNGVAQVMNLP
jgi:sugar lactone lactonase YvrE